MAMQPKIIACGNSVAAITMAIRFLLGPAVMAATSAAVGLRGTLLCVAIVQAALPQGIVPFVFAKEYNLHAAILCTGWDDDARPRTINSARPESAQGMSRVCLLTEAVDSAFI
nr:unnamed protein product [Digitaria exilis]